MPTTYPYHDAYLAPLVTPEIEARAVADVAARGTFTAGDTERLVRLRAYATVCVESQRAEGDLFAAKLATYSKEFAALLPLARAAYQAEQDEHGTGTGAIFAIPLERG